MQAWVEWQHLRKPHVLLKALKAQTSMQTGWILLNKQQNQFYLLLSTNRYSKIPLTNVLRGLFIPDIHPINPSIHPSIHPISYTYPIQSHGEGGAYPTGAQGTLWIGQKTVAGFTQREKLPFALAFTPLANSESQVNLT